MKKFFTILLALCLILSMPLVSSAQSVPETYMELSATGDFSIFTKNMENEELLASVGKTAEEINKILENTGSESIIINRKTGAQIYFKVLKNELSYEFWNIADKENDEIIKNIKSILYDGFSMEGFNYQDENIEIYDYAYMKFITVWGSTYHDGGVKGVVCGGSFVNGNALVFTMLTENAEPTEEEMQGLKDLASNVSFTVIKDKDGSQSMAVKSGEEDIFNYFLGGFGALVLIIFCGYMIAKMKIKDENK